MCDDVEVMSYVEYDDKEHVLEVATVSFISSSNTILVSSILV